MTIAKICTMAAGLSLGLAACSDGGKDRTQPPAADGSSVIDCALGDGSNFAKTCFLEPVASDAEGEYAGFAAIMLRASNGGYRRFYIDSAGAGLIAADGADISINTLSAEGEMLEVSIAQDRYRLPARTVEAAREDAS